MRLFIKCQLKKDLTYLIISGKPTDEQLSISWSDICQAFSEAIGDTKTTMRLFLYKEMALIAITMTEIQLLISALRKRYTPYFHQQLDLLCECSLSLAECQAYSSAYHNCLDRYEKRSKSLAREMKLKQIAYEAMGQGSEGPEPTQAYYDCVFITLTDFAKVNITDEISAFTYCERVRRLNEYCKKMSK